MSGLDESLVKSGLTEEEACFILRFAGRLGYERAIRRLSSPLSTLRKWFVWFGGWEHPELSQWDRGKPAWEVFGRDRQGRPRLKDPRPVALFGHRLSFIWGVQARLHWKGRRWYLVLTRTFRCGPIDMLYLSPDGTPGHPRARMLWQRRPKAAEA